jgi:hypothetical protein
MHQTIIAQNATHKAVAEHGQISIYLKGFDIEGTHYPDEFMYSIAEDMEDDVLAIFERYDEDNRLNVVEFQREYYSSIID